MDQDMGSKTVFCQATHLLTLPAPTAGIGDSLARFTKELINLLYLSI